VGVLLPYSRLHETEADRLGLIFMAMAGYDPQAAIAFWQRMEQAGKNKPRPPVFLATHPPSAQRIEDIRRFLPEAMRYYQKPGAEAYAPEEPTPSAHRAEDVGIAKHKTGDVKESTTTYE
jgi:predicted Zn-dependent protease